MSNDSGDDRGDVDDRVGGEGDGEVTPVAETARRGWLSGEISGPALLLLLAVVVVGGLGGASIGGGFGLAVTLIVLAAMVALLVVWSGAPDKSLQTGKLSVFETESDD